MMIRRNLKLLVLGAVLVLALPAVSLAQMSRVEGMALQGDYVKDWSGIFTYTSQVANVGNLVYGELGNAVSQTLTPPPVDRSVGAVVGNLWEGRLGTWAIHLHQIQPALGQGDTTGSSAPGNLGTDPNTNNTESFDIMWGKKFGTKSLGLRLNKSTGEQKITVAGATSKVEYDFAAPTGPNFARNVMGFGAGLGLEMNPTTNVELSIDYQSRTWKDESAAGTAENDGSAAYLFSGRAMWQWQPSIMVVPVFKYYNYDLGEKSTPTGGPTTAFKNSIKGWQVGGAGNWTLGSNDLFVLGLTIAQNKLEQDEALFAVGGLPGGFGQVNKVTESLTPQLFAALETHVNSWLTLRFGANKGAWEKVKVESTTGNVVEQTYSTFNMNLGTGLKFGNLQLDAILNDNFPNNLPYFISGNPTSNMLTKVTATYPW